MAVILRSPWLSQGHCNLRGCRDWHRAEATHDLEYGRGEPAVWMCSMVVDFWPELEPHRHKVRFVVHNSHPRRRCYRLNRSPGMYYIEIRGLSGAPVFTKEACSIAMLNVMVVFIDLAWAICPGKYVWITIELEEIL